MSLRLRYAAISDVGRVRKDNQDSGYAGPWLLTVCDGVGGSARGDVASSTAIGQLRRLDQPPSPDHTPEDLLAQIAGGLHRAHDRIAELVDHDPELDGTSTTATVALFDGTQVAMGHVGDSRAYLVRTTDGQPAIAQLTHDHTFVQTLLDEGRISEAEARTHPHRNLILRALDGRRDAEPDLFVVPVQAGDRLLLCSDGVSGVLEDGRLADILSGGSVDYAAVELVRASLEAGSSDNVTCIVAEVVDTAAGAAEAGADRGEDSDATTGDLEAQLAAQEPQLVGAAAELRRRLPKPHLFKGHRNGDTGELDPVPADAVALPIPPGAIATDPLNHDASEAARYAPRAPSRFAWVRRLVALAVLVGLLWAATGAGWAWTQRQYYVGAHDGVVTIFRGVDATVLGVELGKPYQQSDLELDELADYDAGKVRSGIPASDLTSARRAVQNLAAKAQPASTPSGTASSSTSPSAASPSASRSASPSASPTTTGAQP